MKILRLCPKATNKEERLPNTATQSPEHRQVEKKAAEVTAGRKGHTASFLKDEASGHFCEDLLGSPH